MIQLDDRQQRLAYIGAVVAAVGFVAAQAAALPESIGLIVIGWVLAGFLAFGARRRSVMLTGAGAFVVSFGPWGGLWFLGAAYIAFGGLLMFRASKQAAEAGGPRPPRKQKKQPVEEPPAKKPPSGSKRYTPPTKRAKRSGGT